MRVYNSNKSLPGSATSLNTSGSTCRDLRSYSTNGLSKRPATIEDCAKILVSSVLLGARNEIKERNRLKANEVLRNEANLYIKQVLGELEESRLKRASATKMEFDLLKEVAQRKDCSKYVVSQVIIPSFADSMATEILTSAFRRIEAVDKYTSAIATDIFDAAKDKAIELLHKDRATSETKQSEMPLQENALGNLVLTNTTTEKKPLLSRKMNDENNLATSPMQKPSIQESRNNTQIENAAENDIKITATTSTNDVERNNDSDDIASTTSNPARLACAECMFSCVLSIVRSIRSCIRCRKRMRRSCCK